VGGTKAKGERKKGGRGTRKTSLEKRKNKGGEKKKSREKGKHNKKRGKGMVRYISTDLHQRGQKRGKRGVKGVTKKGPRTTNNTSVGKKKVR